MDPRLVDADDNHRAPRGQFGLGEFKRLIGLVRPYRGTLVWGLIATVAFAALHTASIGGMFPIFKMMLEEEGLQGWADRTVVSRRYGLDLAALTDADEIRVVGVVQGGAAEVGGVRAGDTISRPEGGAGFLFVHDLAHETGEIAVRIGTNQLKRDVPLAGTPSDRTTRLLGVVGSLVPRGDKDKQVRVLAYILLGLVLVVIIANTCRYVGEVLIAKCILKAMIDLRTQLYDCALHLPMSFYAGQETSDIVTRFVQDVQEVQRGLITLFGKFIREPLRAIFILSLAFTLDWRLTMTMLVAAPFAVGVFWFVGRSVKGANRKLLQAYGNMIGALTTSLQNLRVVKAYTAEHIERERLNRVDWRMFTQQHKLVKLQAFVSPMMEVVAVVAGSFVTLWLSARVMNHELELSRFLALGVTLGVLFDPLRKLSDVYVRVQRSVAGAERIFGVIDQPVETPVGETAIKIAPLKRSIEYASVTFTYPGAMEPALKEINLSIRHGETLAIVGPNGSGKTTLVSMLPRFFDPDSGAITYDGVDIREAQLASLRRQIGMVSQESVIFAGTPLANIEYGRPSTDGVAARAAAVRAHADEFIQAIPQAYDAALGERGMTLSGGQRQRLAIARAIYRDAPILIFDEATSQIDTESEAKIQEALEDFSKGRTTLVIAHRLSTIQFATRIVVMEAGRIIDTGSHADLFDRCGLYRSLCETQFVTEPSAATQLK